MQNAFDGLVGVTGIEWLYALGALFIAMIAESGHPPHEPGEDRPPTPLRVLAFVATSFALLLLLAHAYGASTSARESPFLPVSAVLVVSALGALLGALLAKVSAIGNAFQAAAPVLAVAACAFTIWVTWRQVWALVEPLLPR